MNDRISLENTQKIFYQSTRVFSFFLAIILINTYYYYIYFLIKEETIVIYYKKLLYKLYYNDFDIDDNEPSFTRRRTRSKNT